MYPELVRIPFLNLPVHTYGVMIVTGFLCALYIAYLQAAREGKYHEDILDFGFWALLGGIMGARIVFILVEWRTYFIDRPWTALGNTGIKIPSVLAFWQGGLVYWGAIIGGFVAFLIFSRKRNIPKLAASDMLFLGVPLAQTFGRLGCVAAGCCYGKEAYHLDALGNVIKDFPITLQFPENSSTYSTLFSEGNYAIKDLMEHMHSTLPLFPSQLAEAFGTLVIFFILLIVYRYKRFHGQVFLSYAIFYSIMRSFLEQFRGDTARGFVFDTLSTSQFISIIVVSLSLITMAVIFIKQKKSLVKS